ncbi:MAG: hypothetical protein HYV60_22335 [Planctomycetia bacterium]|nr:hypothetical protein [Planctomycetia bacterium]
MKFRRSFPVSLPLLIIAAGVVLHPVSAAAADSPQQAGSTSSACCDVDRADDIWLISTRHLGCPSRDKTGDDDIYLHVEHHGGKGVGWLESSLDEFFASGDPAQPTMIYVPGNRVDWNDAIERGTHVRDAVLGGSQIEPIRFVIWSWPSDQIHGQIKDVRVKAARTNGEAHYLAWFLSRCDAGTPLRILGYSYGARVTTGALHVLGGGKLAGQTLPDAQPRRLRVALLAAAVHNYWLQPGACHEYALSQMDRLLIQYNSCDPVLKRYHIVEKRAHPAALGYTGMHADETEGAWIEQHNVCCIVGNSHAEARYFNSSTLTDEIREALFGG